MSTLAQLWASRFVANTHEDLDHPPNVHLITGSVQQPHKESLSFRSPLSPLYTIAKAFSPQPAGPSSTCSPSKVVDIRMEQLRCLQQLQEDGILTEEEFVLQKNIVLKSLNKLV